MAKAAYINVAPEEAMMIDHVITLHSYDSGYLEELKKPLFADLRKKVSEAIASNQETLLSFTESEVEHLLIAVPITFRFTKENCGYNFKVKLFKSQLPQPMILPSPIVEGEKDVPKTDSDNNLFTSNQYTNYDSSQDCS